MKDITRRSFLKRTGLVGATLCIAPSIVFGKNKNSKKDNLKREVSGLMEDTDLYVEYHNKHTSSTQLIDSKQIIGSNIPMKKLYEIKRRLIEHVNEHDPLDDESGVLVVYSNIDII